jgi:2-oxoglutarate dehydrogenase E2 component (dihydrolipoamide succinyltransferase)
MALQDLIMPKMGESVAEATIIKWTKAVGDSIKQDETVLEIATDKVDSEIPSPFEGVLQEVLFKEGEVVQVGSVIARISNSQTASTSPKKVSTEPVLAAASKASTPETPKPVVAAQASNDSRFYSPLVKSIAKSEQITSEELAQIPGTGHEGRVTKADLIQYLSERLNPDTSQKLPKKPSQALTETTTPVSPKKQEVTVQMGDEIIEMDRMRKLIADHMVMSKQVSPHVTSFVEADVTALVKWREKNKSHFEKSYGEKLTFTPLFIESVARAIRDFPMINVSVDPGGTKIIKRKSVNIGMAAALPSGNLIVPVIKQADEKNLLGLAKSVNDLAQRARAAKLQPDEIQGGTFTLTNVGNFGNVMGTPIINQPQVAILATGTIKKKPAVLETEQGDVIAIRHMMFLSLSYDHRVVDGSLGGTFLRRVADYLEQWDINRSV